MLFGIVVIVVDFFDVFCWLFVLEESVIGMWWIILVLVYESELVGLGYF